MTAIPSLFPSSTGSVMCFMGEFEVDDFASSATFPVEGESHSGRCAVDRVVACPAGSLGVFVVAQPTVNVAKVDMTIKIISTEKVTARFICSKLLAKR